MERTAVEYGAQIERGVILSVEADGYIVASEDRPGVETPPIKNIHKQEHVVGERVLFFMFDNGDARIVDENSYLSASGGTLTGPLMFESGTEDKADTIARITAGQSKNGANSDSDNDYVIFKGVWTGICLQNRYKATKKADGTETWYPARIFFRQWSAPANSGAHLNKHETYYLPECADGLGSNQSYLILTTKEKITPEQGGTGVGKASANKVFAGPVSGSDVAPAFRALAAADIPNLDADKINSGVFAVARIPNLDADKINSGVFAVARIPNLDADKINSGVFAVARIPNLGADKINSGVFNAERIPNLDADKINSGVFNAARIPNLDTSKINSGTFSGARMLKEKTFTSISADSNGNYSLSGLTPSNATVVSVYLAGTGNCVCMPWVYYANASSAGQWTVKFLKAAGLEVATGSITGTLHVLYMTP